MVPDQALTEAESLLANCRGRHVMLTAARKNRWARCASASPGEARRSSVSGAFRAAIAPASRSRSGVRSL